MSHRINQNIYISGLLDCILPPLCLGCGEIDNSSTDVCPDCFKRFDFYEYPLCLNCNDLIPNGTNCSFCKEKSWPLFVYGSYQKPLKEIILQLKFKGITSPARLFAKLITDKFDEKIWSLNADCLVPVPLYPTRENIRGYNQAELIANELGEKLELPVLTNLIERTINRSPQARLDLAHRTAHIKGCYTATEEQDQLQKIILVDDVVTSGATVNEMRRVLEKNGHEVLGTITIAHSR